MNWTSKDALLTAHITDLEAIIPVHQFNLAKLIAIRDSPLTLVMAY